MQIDRIMNISNEILQTVYIARDNPVIISDSHEPWQTQISSHHIDSFIHFLQAMPYLPNAIPCNTLTNLHSSTVKIKHLLNRIERGILNEWILQIRLCDFESVKATRSIFRIGHRPYYIPSYWPPFKSSWLLLSHQYEMSTMNQLPVDGVVIVLQLKGTLNGRLEVRAPCVERCFDQQFQLVEGESLLFTSELWNLVYNFIPQNEGTITFIQEIDLN